MTGILASPLATKTAKHNQTMVSVTRVKFVDRTNTILQVCGTVFYNSSEVLYFESPEAGSTKPG